MHFGATLRLLRVDAGVSLRALAQQVGVSSAYLSRVENGHDQAPTTDRLLEIARALDLPPTLLIELAQRVTPFVTTYLAAVPSASHLFLEIARRQLGGAQLARLHAFMDSEFPAAAPGGPVAPRIGDLLRPDRVIVRLSCAHLGDAIDVAATRLVGPGGSASELAWEIHRREREAPTAVGHGVAIPHVAGAPAGVTPGAALVTLATPVPGTTPDGAPLQIVLVLVGAPLVLLARAVRLATPETVASLTAARDPEAVLTRLRHTEAAFG